MRFVKGNPVVAMGLAGVLALGLAGCSASSESTTTVTTEVTDENGVTTTRTSETSTTIGDNGITSSSTSSTGTVIDIADWENAWEGVSSKGLNIYYAQASDTPQALIAIYDPSTGVLDTAVGDMETVGEGQVKVTDAGNGDAFVFEILGEADDGTTTIDLGDDYGTVDLTPCGMGDLIDELVEVDTEGVLISE